MQNHLETECLKQVVACPFGECGCEYRGPRSDITAHMKESPGLHLNVAGKTIAIQKKLLQAYEERMDEQKKWIELLARRVNALDKAYGAQYIWKIDRYQVNEIHISMMSVIVSIINLYHLGETWRGTYKQENNIIQSTISY